MVDDDGGPRAQRGGGGVVGAVPFGGCGLSCLRILVRWAAAPASGPFFASVLPPLATIVAACGGWPRLLGHSELDAIDHSLGAALRWRTRTHKLSMAKTVLDKVCCSVL